jgi:metal-dependent amidase/aminoacylase/carboxypeptidase family protein
VDPIVRDRLREMVERTVAGAAAMGAVDHELTWSEIVPPIVNDARLAACAREVGREILGHAQIHELSVPPMTADDFAFFTQLAPSLYLKLGVCGGDACPPLHNGGFDVDERAIGAGVAVMHGIALRLLAHPLERWADD